MGNCVFAGSFDPITLGHLEIIEKASAIYEKVIVGVLINWDKNYYFTNEQRVEMVTEACKNFKNVTVKFFNGTLVDFLKSEQEYVFVRGIRNEKDLQYENLCKEYNKKFLPQIEYVYFKSEKYKDVSSTLVKENFKDGKEIKELVPQCVLKYFKG